MFYCLSKVLSDDDVRVEHSDVTRWRTKCPYKAALFPYQASKKWEWSTRYFRFVYFTCQRHVTEAKNQSNFIISLKCGPPGFPFLLWYAHLEQNIVIKTTFKYRADHSHFLMPYREKVLPYMSIFARHRVMSDWVHPHTIITFFVFCYFSFKREIN